MEGSRRDVSFFLRDGFFSIGTFITAGIDSSNKRVEIALVRGEARKILAGERTALNLLSRASGIATMARKLRELADKEHFKGKIAGTRKTTPGFRVVEKYAMLIGGCDTHRMDLSSMIMLKDNHIWSCGSISNAVKKALSVGGFSLKVEVECQSLSEAEEAAEAGADIVMLDNFDHVKLKATAHTLKSHFPKLLIEASGGISIETIAQYLNEDIDIVSLGSLTQGAPYVDFSLKIRQ